MKDLAIRVDDLRRGFGRQPVLRGASFSVPRGSITTLLGRNGVGKTTALKCIVGLIRAEGGRIYLMGRDAVALDDATRAGVGYLSERQAMDPRLTVGQTIAWARAFHDRRWDDALVADLLERFELHPTLPVAALSMGGARKLGLVVAVAHRPDVLLLDEPAANLDAVARRDMLEVILDVFRSAGTSILLSTHLLSDVERVADRVVLMEDGRTRVESDLDDLRETVKSLRLIPRNGTDIPDFELPGLLSWRRSGREVLVTVERYHARLADEIGQQAGARVEVRDLPLEDIFLAYARRPERSALPFGG